MSQSILYLNTLNCTALFHTTQAERHFRGGSQLRSEVFLHNGISRPPDKAVTFTLVLQYPQLGVNIVFKLVIIPVKVIGCDIGQHSSVDPCAVHPVELKTA